MKTYNVSYEETLRRCYAIEAESEEEAIEKLWQAVEDEKVVLTADDYVCESGNVFSHGELDEYSVLGYSLLDEEE